MTIREFPIGSFFIAVFCLAGLAWHVVQSVRRQSVGQWRMGQMMVFLGGLIAQSPPVLYRTAPAPAWDFISSVGWGTVLLGLLVAWRARARSSVAHL